MMSALHHN